MEQNGKYFEINENNKRRKFYARFVSVYCLEVALKSNLMR